MPWVTFFAGRDDLLALLRFAAVDAGCHILDAAPPFDCQPRQFPTVEAVAALPELGVHPLVHLALWSPELGPAPAARRIELRPDAVPDHVYRITLEGCCLITLHCRAILRGALEASSLGWWTEAAARSKAAPHLKAEAANWKALAALGRRLRYHITRRLAETTVDGRPVLPQALVFARGGGNLRDPHAPTHKFRVAGVPMS